MKKRRSFCCLALILILLLQVLLVPVQAREDLPFRDVKEKDWFYGSVAAAWEKGLISGVSDTKFAPEGKLSLAQAVTLAARMHQLEDRGEVTLENGETLWYATYVDYALEEGIVEPGVYDGRWTQEAKRADFVHIFYHAMEERGYKAINTVEDNAIPDVTAATAYAGEIYTFYRAGILTGGTKGEFLPDQSIKRSEVAAIMARMVDSGQRRSFTLEYVPPTESGQLPGFHADIAQENVLAILDAYDPDGAYLLRQTLDRGEDFMFWFNGCSNITEGIGTAVHEETHGFTHNWDSWNIYCGQGVKVVVPKTQVFNSNEIVSMVPEHLRTFRFDTYVNTNDNMDSAVNGVYGLLNEFAAYYWGTHCDLCLYSYYANFDDPTVWLQFARSVYGSYSARAEFRYYILTYLLYARENHPQVYEAILNNKQFVAAYNYIDFWFEVVIAVYLEQIRLLDAESSQVRLDGGFLFVGNSGYGCYNSDYDLLMDAMEAPEYVEMAQILFDVMPKE